MANILVQNIDLNKTISDIVRSDYRTADVFKKHGINYCCSGQVSLQDACDVRSLDHVVITCELEEATRSVRLPNGLRFGEWKMDFLADYITNVHHAYLYQTLPVLESRVDSFIDGHKKKFGEL
jgi:regulator of cell morphogenesis and NO signaling